MAKLGPDDRPGFKTIGVVDGYDRWAPTYDREPNPLVTLEEPVTLAQIGDIRGQRILDLGCGTGRYCALLAALGAEVIGLDPSARMLDQARRKLTEICGFDLHLGTLEQAGFPSAHFHLVLSALTLAHLPNLAPILTEAARVLKPGGRLVVSDIHPYWPVSGHDYTEFFDETGQEYRIPQHPHLIEDYWRLFERLGLTLEDIREPRIDQGLVGKFPSLAGYEGTPLAIVLRARSRA